MKSALADTFPGRFTKLSPAAVELHVDLDLFSETANQIVLSPDSSAERQFLPPVERVVGGLLLAERGDFERGYFEALDIAGGHFIVRSGQLNSRRTATTGHSLSPHPRLFCLLAS